MAKVGDFLTRCRNDKIMFAGDLNCKSRKWGCTKDNSRGRLLRDWAVGMGLRVLNRGQDPTCVRRQGTSRVEVSFAIVSHRETAVREAESQAWRLLFQRWR